MLDAKTETYLVIFSEGDKGRWGEKYASMRKSAFERLRMSETRKSGKLLGVDHIKTLHFDDRRISPTQATIRKLRKEIVNISPDVIFSFEFRKLLNYDPHPDHLAVGEIVKQAILSLKDQQIDYYVFTSIMPNNYIDISKIRKVKIQAIKIHETQRLLNRIIFPVLEYAPTRILGIIKKSRFIEAYRKVTLKSPKTA